MSLSSDCKRLIISPAVQRSPARAFWGDTLAEGHVVDVARNRQLGLQRTDPSRRSSETSPRAALSMAIEFSPTAATISPLVAIFSPRWRPRISPPIGMVVVEGLGRSGLTPLPAVACASR